MRLWVVVLGAFILLSSLLSDVSAPTEEERRAAEAYRLVGAVIGVLVLALGLRLRSKVQCPQCRGAVFKGERFCMSCGTASPLICSTCGQAKAEYARFCTHCGVDSDRHQPMSGSPPPSE